jgi:hypothetical protein
VEVEMAAANVLVALGVVGFGVIDGGEDITVDGTMIVSDSVS